MKCVVCRGACCQEITIEVHSGVAFPGAMVEWLEARGVAADKPPNAFIVPSRCPQLTVEGLCGCHDDKPLVCAMMPVGGDDCLGSVRRLRTPEQYREIRDEGDPETIHAQ